MTLSRPVPARAKAIAAGNDAERGRGDEGRQPHAGESRHQVDQEERKCRHQPQEQQIAEGVVAEALRELRSARACPPQQRLTERGARHQEDEGRPQRRPDHRRRCTDRKAEQEAAGHREKHRPRQRQADDRDIERDIAEHGQDPVLVDEGVDRHAVADQRLERDAATPEHEIDATREQHDHNQGSSRRGRLRGRAADGGVAGIRALYTRSADLRPEQADLTGL